MTQIWSRPNERDKDAPAPDSPVNRPPSEVLREKRGTSVSTVLIERIRDEGVLNVTATKAAASIEWPAEARK
jgi:hypothetical protein